MASRHLGFEEKEGFQWSANLEERSGSEGNKSKPPYFDPGTTKTDDFEGRKKEFHLLALSLVLWILLEPFRVLPFPAFRESSTSFTEFAPTFRTYRDRTWENSRGLIRATFLARFGGAGSSSQFRRERNLRVN